MTARDHMPGVPAAGHITPGGYWHPGAAEVCGKCDTPRRDPQSMFSNARLAQDLRRLADNIRWCDPVQRENTLREAANRIYRMR